MSPAALLAQQAPRRAAARAVVPARALPAGRRRHADEHADEVIRSAGPGPARGAAPCACGGGCPRCGARGEQPVPAPFRRRAEATLGVPLDDVRLTRGGALATLAATRGADAATSGTTIAFSSGWPDLSRPEGRFALGHELAHVAQQQHAGGRGPLGRLTDPAGSRDERRADVSAGGLSAGAGTGAGGRARGPRTALRTGLRSAELVPAVHAGAPVQFGAFETVGGAARAVDDLVAPVVDPLVQTVHGQLAEVLMSQFDIPAHLFTYVASMPLRLLRLLSDAVSAPVGVSQWTSDLVGLFVNWQGFDPVWDHLLQGVLDGAAFAGEYFIHALETVGTGEFLQFLWARSHRLAPLNSEQIGAAREVHPPGLVPYSLVRVDHNSIVARLAALFSGGGTSVWQQIVGTAGAEHRAVTTMHVIHVGHTMDSSLAVHELTHVGQYELVGAMYMAQALYAQEFGQGYDYNSLHGSLSAAVAAGATYADFNREQQAQICQDYYDVTHGLPARWHGSEADLEYFINDYWGRAGVPVLRHVVAQ
ncbi:eCIS core domain-containing protein [Kineococcus indalonis]|uniref:eCIS core domain-containing protein n=1 Tax=Kineococcus indalonis TaxID=2696566 RepID=UPI0014123ED4|nr:DUF4157 domain-containing protein [Kineococcus indalonis]NAZ84906.1 DUF4157 domain-containing protein [Kineococcus indalonis]